MNATTNGLSGGLLAAAMLLSAVGANATNETTEQALQSIPSLEQVDRIPTFGRIYSWHAIGKDSLIVWRNPFDPYIVRLDFPAYDIMFAKSIGITQSGGSVRPGFDAIYVRGMRYQIAEIYHLGRDDAKALY